LEVSLISASLVLTMILMTAINRHSRILLPI